PRRAAVACSYASAVTFACAARPAGGSKRRVSRSRFSSVSLIDRAPLHRQSSIAVWQRKVPSTSCRFRRVANTPTHLMRSLAHRRALLVGDPEPATVCHRGGVTHG